MLESVLFLNPPPAPPAAGDARVAAAAEAFGAGVTAVLAALGDDAGLLADKLQQAGVTYEAVDRRAVPAR
jgi:hypothetical protein